MWGGRICRLLHCRASRGFLFVSIRRAGFSRTSSAKLFRDDDGRASRNFRQQRPRRSPPHEVALCFLEPSRHAAESSFKGLKLIDLASPDLTSLLQTPFNGPSEQQRLACLAGFGSALTNALVSDRENPSLACGPKNSSPS